MRFPVLPLLDDKKPFVFFKSRRGGKIQSIREQTLERGRERMSHRENHLRQTEEAVDGLVNLFAKASNELQTVQYKLEKEFEQTYPDNANPVKLVQRIKKLQEDVSILTEQCQDLLSAKQDLIDKARVTLVGNRSMLQRINSSLGITGNTETDEAFDNFNQILSEWTIQVTSKTECKNQESASEDVNRMLFSAIFRSS